MLDLVDNDPHGGISDPHGGISDLHGGINDLHMVVLLESNINVFFPISNTTLSYNDSAGHPSHDSR